MTITLQEDLSQSKTVMFILEIDLASSRFFQSSSQVSDDKTSTVSLGNNAQSNNFFHHFNLCSPNK
jgi:hypothetical protein